ncbi:MAG: response regulator receiver modulated diguanylate cyclase/phosphodiesterase with sensor [Acidimicrobiaceae bacterium]|nr:response regulator receiver modulated diguanylate cyclase/phosphodiesterase with sensor [Acidimicrobiaceae bacterium]
MKTSTAAIIAGTSILGAGSAALIAWRFAAIGLGSPGVLATLGVFVVASWIWQMTMYVDSTSQAHNLDEGFFLVAALVLPPSGVLLIFGLAAAIAQVVHRRAPSKSVFNFFMELLAISAGLAVQHAIAPPTGHLTVLEVAAAGLASMAYFAVNSALVSAVVASLGQVELREVLFGGTGLRVRVLGASLCLGLVGGVAVSAYPSTVVLVGIAFWLCRLILASHFRARHDRTRTLGLFDAALDVHRTMGEAAVTEALSKSASSLLRSPRAELLDEAPADSSMAAEVTVDGITRWLSVDGRSRQEPFDEADRALLGALAAVGSGALANSALYEELRLNQQQTAAITSSLAEGVCAFDVEGRLAFLNPAAEVLLGRSAAEVRSLVESGHAMTFLFEPAHHALSTNSASRDKRSVFVRSDGIEFPVEFSCSLIHTEERVEGAVLAFRDISEQMAYEDQLAHQAFHDALTGLPNRRLFLYKLERVLNRTERGEYAHAVLFVDIDRFKLTNDSLGHQAGDQLLVTIAERLSTLVSEGDTLARFGGDEFTVLLERVAGAAEAESAAREMLDLITSPISLEGGRSVVVSASIGVALGASGVSPDDVVHDADVAMYEVKRAGTGGVGVFDSGAMAKRSAERIDLEAELREAIGSDELQVYYQPIFATGTGRMIGAEALARWEHPGRGLLEPARFISLAEETGLILALDRAVLERACMQGCEWLAQTSGAFTISVNLSPRQFQAKDLVETIRSTLAKTGFPPSHLCLEITESLACHNLDRSIATLGELKKLGVRLAIDDFGTGYSSLSYLKRFPVDIVKLDRSFVVDFDSSPVDAAILAAVIDLALKIGMVPIAEGVETSEQLAGLAAMGCPVVQGFLLARPMSARELALLLRRDSALPESDTPIATIAWAAS